MLWWKCASCLKFNWSTKKHDAPCWKCGKTVKMAMREMSHLGEGKYGPGLLSMQEGSDHEGA